MDLWTTRIDEILSFSGMPADKKLHGASTVAGRTHRTFGAFSLLQSDGGERYDEAVETACFIARVLSAGAASAFRLWRFRIDIFARYSTETLSALLTDSEPGGWPQRKLVDTVRAYFRELAEAHDRETHRFQQELESCLHDIALKNRPGEAQVYKRRWRAKS